MTSECCHAKASTGSTRPVSIRGFWSFRARVRCVVRVSDVWIPLCQINLACRFLCAGGPDLWKVGGPTRSARERLRTPSARRVRQRTFLKVPQVCYSTEGRGWFPRNLWVLRANPPATSRRTKLIALPIYGAHLPCFRTRSRSLFTLYSLLPRHHTSRWTLLSVSSRSRCSAIVCLPRMLISW